MTDQNSYPIFYPIDIVPLVSSLVFNPLLGPDLQNYSSIVSNLSNYSFKTFDSRLDPSDFWNLAIREACENGHLDVVKLLLQDSRVDPSANDNEAVQSAFENGHAEIFKLLLRDPRVDASRIVNDAIRRAQEKGRMDELFPILLSFRK